MKSLFATVLSTFLSAVALVIKLLVFFPAFFILDFPFWLSLLAAAFISFVPVFGSVLNIVLWLWALVVCLNSATTALSVIFYILFALNALDLIQAVVRTITQMRHEY